MATEAASPPPLRLSGGVVMNIGPVQVLGAAGAAQSTETNVQARRAQPSAAPAAANSQEQPNSGTIAKQEIQHAQNVAAENERAQDVVEVQRDSQLVNQIVIKYLDPATGREILQVPSAGVLSVYRGISQDLQQEAKRESSSSPTTVQGVKHGH